MFAHAVPSASSCIEISLLGCALMPKVVYLKSEIQPLLFRQSVVEAKTAPKQINGKLQLYQYKQAWSQLKSSRLVI